MEIKEYEKLHRFEENNWWYKAKRRLIVGFLKSVVLNGKKSELKILDVGCGTGINALALSKFGEIHAIDYSSEALKFCKTRGIKNIKLASATKLPYDDESFDVVGCFDVLYHKEIKDDMDAINEIYRVCKKDGYFLMTDSAMMCLWSKHDVVQHSRTRYSTKDIRGKFRKAGFEIKKLSYYYSLIFPIVYLARKLDNINLFGRSEDPKVNVYGINKATNSVLDFIMKIEYFFIKRMNMPFGSSVFCVAKKK